MTGQGSGFGALVALLDGSEAVVTVRTSYSRELTQTLIRFVM